MNYRAQNCIEKLRKRTLPEGMELLYQWVKTVHLNKGEFEDVLTWFLRDNGGL